MYRIVAAIFTQVLKTSRRFIFTRSSFVISQPKMSNSGTKFVDFTDTYFSAKSSSTRTIKLSVKATANDLVARICKVDKLMEQSVLKPGIAKQDNLPPYKESMRQLKKQRKIEREKTKGSKWFDLPATPITDEIKDDMAVMQMRSILDKKHFYKRNNMKVLPKYFQVGTVMDDAADFYHDRVPRKERKQTLVDELLADAEFRKRNKKVYVQTLKTDWQFRKRNKLQAKRFLRKGSNSKSNFRRN